MAPTLLPGLVRRVTVSRALDRRKAGQVSIEQLAANRLVAYDGLGPRFPVAVVGAALGGAAAYLSAALGGPFLPEPFILAFRGGSLDDNLEPVLATTGRLEAALRPSMPDVLLIHHFDPIHDGWLTPYVHHLRLKPTSLPQAYRRFLLDRLQPGATIVHLDCQASWLAFSLGENSRLQVGGWGDIPPQEYLDGSPRIDAWLRARGSAHRGGWRPPGLEASWLPESEWGAEPDFGQSLAEFAAQAGFDYIPVSYRHPHHYSLLALGLVEAMYRHNNTQPAGSFVGMFNLYDPSTVFSRRLLPLWLVFNTTDSLHFLRALIDQLVDPIYLAALVTYSRPPD